MPWPAAQGVELELKPSVVLNPDKIRIPSGVSGQQPFDIPFRDFLAALVAGVGVPVSVDIDGNVAQVHAGFPPEPAGRLRWLRTLACVPANVNEPGD